MAEKTGTPKLAGAIASFARRSKRSIAQAASAIGLNAYFPGFATGQIYQGELKAVCVPVLNCYSCPGAVGSCPIGALQAVIGFEGQRIGFYVLGLIALFGTMLGRFFCGWICPFGLVQDLLHKIPTPKLKVPPKVNAVLKYLKYAMLAVFVIGLPFALQDEFGYSDPFFCKLICPAGTLEGGLPLTLLVPDLQAGLGLLFIWKVSLLVTILAAVVFVYRAFCRYLCPLGALYALFNGISLYGLKVDGAKCNGCGACSRACPMDLEVSKKPNDPECIRCGKCKSACPTDAIRGKFTLIEKKASFVKRAG